MVQKDTNNTSYAQNAGVRQQLDMTKNILRIAAVAVRLVTGLSVALMLSSCAAENGGASFWQTLLADKSDAPSGKFSSGGTSRVTPGQSGPPQKPLIVLGNDQLVGASRGLNQNGALQTEDGVLLNFEDTDLREVVQTILGEIAKKNYLFDPRVSGKVTLQTVAPLSEADTLATLETILRQNGAAMVMRDELYNIVPVAEAGSGLRIQALAGGEIALRPGHSVLVAPLKSASASELAELLDPLAGPQTTVRFDAARNVLILSGNRQELQSLRETITLFDVDWMDGLSYGLFPLKSARADAVADELRTVLGGNASPLRDQATIKPITRLNAILAVTKKRKILRDVQSWVARLDRDSGSDGESVYVYQVENARASDIAKVLQDVFADNAGGGSGVAPGQQVVNISEDGDNNQGGLATAISFENAAAVRIMANDTNNSLVIRAQPQDYTRIQAIIRQLDTVPLQVMIDATIAEVALTNQLSYGVQFFLQNGNVSVTNSNGSSGAIAASFPGLAASFVRGDAQAILSAIDSVTSLNVISSPRIMVLDNQSARLKVGDEVPIITQQQQNPDSTASIVNNVNFRQTGVVLEVKPRVNSSGLVTLDIVQETSNVVENNSTGDLTPTIAQRTIESSIAVQDGNTILLGGMIQERNSANKSGVPGLSDVPILGALFGTRGNGLNRTELIVLLTPRVIRNPNEVRDATEEMRRHLQAMTPQMFPKNELTRLKRQ